MLAVTGLNHSVYRGTEKEANAGLAIVQRPKGSKQDLQWFKRGPRFVSSNEWLIFGFRHEYKKYKQLFLNSSTCVAKSCINVR